MFTFFFLDVLEFVKAREEMIYEISFALLVFLSRDLVSIILFALCEPKRDKQRRNFE